MLSYDRVRISLRGMKHLEVLLTEVPKQADQSHLFPPIITRINENDTTRIDWAMFLSVPVLLWYAPVPLPFYDDLRRTEHNISRLSIYNPVSKIMMNDPYAVRSS